MSLKATDLSDYGKAPLSRYSGQDDPRYIRLAARIRSFLQEFFFFRAVKNGPVSELTRILETDRIDPDKAILRGEAALHIATRLRSPETVAVLISRYADLDSKTKDGKTALQIAVENLDRNMVELLLKKGAKPEVRCSGGKSLADLLRHISVDEQESATEQSILDLLVNPPLVDGPFRNPFRISSQNHHGKANRERYQDWPQPPPQPDGETACKAFNFTIGNFFTTQAGQEVFDLRVASVHDVLYVTGPEDISRPVLAQAEKTQKGLGKTRFSWYHVPANNVRSNYPSFESGN